MKCGVKKIKGIVWWSTCSVPFNCSRLELLFSTQLRWVRIRREAFGWSQLEDKLLRGNKNRLSWLSTAECLQLNCRQHVCKLRSAFMNDNHFLELSTHSPPLPFSVIAAYYLFCVSGGAIVLILGLHFSATAREVDVRAKSKHSSHVSVVGTWHPWVIVRPVTDDVRLGVNLQIFTTCVFSNIQLSPYKIIKRNLVQEKNSLNSSWTLLP